MQATPVADATAAHDFKLTPTPKEPPTNANANANYSQ
jgi:hypothetical protein